MKRSVIDVWTEFMELGWSGGIIKDEQRVKDLEVLPKIFLRKNSGVLSIHYLPIATILEIPAPWLSILGEFNVWIGGRIDEVLEYSKTLSTINRFGYWLSLFGRSIECSLCGINREWFLGDVISNLSDLGTEEWREWMMENWQLKLPNWTMNNLETSIEI